MSSLMSFSWCSVTAKPDKNKWGHRAVKLSSCWKFESSSQRCWGSPMRRRQGRNSLTQVKNEQNSDDMNAIASCSAAIMLLSSFSLNINAPGRVVADSSWSPGAARAPLWQPCWRPRVCLSVWKPSTRGGQTRRSWIFRQVQSSPTVKRLLWNNIFVKLMSMNSFTVLHN